MEQATQSIRKDATIRLDRGIKKIVDAYLDVHRSSAVSSGIESGLELEIASSNLLQGCAEILALSADLEASKRAADFAALNATVDAIIKK